MHPVSTELWNDSSLHLLVRRHRLRRKFKNQGKKKPMHHKKRQKRKYLLENRGKEPHRRQSSLRSYRRKTDQTSHRKISSWTSYLENRYKKRENSKTPLWQRPRNPVSPSLYPGSKEQPPRVLLSCMHSQNRKDLLCVRS